MWSPDSCKVAYIVDLRGNDDHGLAHQLFGKAAQLTHDDFVVVDRIAFAEVAYIDEMGEQPRTFDVAQELQPEPMTFVRAFDDARDVGDDEALEVVRGDDAQVRLEGRKRVIGDLRMRGGNP